MNSKTAILFLLILIGSTIYGNNKTTNLSNSQFVANLTKSTTTQKLDSIVVPSGIKYVNEYDINGNISNILLYLWNKNSWFQYASYKITQAADSIVIQSYGNSNYSYYKKITCDNEGRITEKVVKDEDGFTKKTYKHNNHGKLEQYCEYTADAFNSKWNLWEKIDYLYDDRQNLISKTDYWMGCGDCINGLFGKTEYTYNDYGQKILEFDYYRESAKWNLSYKYEYSYDTSGNCTQIGYKWLTSQWVISRKIESAIDAYGNISQQTYYEWKNSQWLEQNKTNALFSSYTSLLSPLEFIPVGDFSCALCNIGEVYLNPKEEKIINYEKNTWTNNSWKLNNHVDFYYSNSNSDSSNSVCNLSGSIIDGLVAYYPFCGNANDESGNGNDGTVSGATLTTDRFGNQNSAFQFSGSDNSYIRVPNSSSLDITNNQITISMWVLQENTDSDLNWKGITKGGWDFGSGYELLYRNSYKGDRGGIQLSGNNGGIQADDVDINGNHSKWIHVVGLYDNDKGRVYINGKLISSGFRGKTFSNFISTDSPLLIGIRDSRNQYVGYVDGRMDDIGIWNRILSEQEIQELYHENGYDENCVSLNGSIKNGLVAYYPFCGNANDESGNGLNGTVNGATLASDRFGDQNSAYSFTTNQDIVIPNTETQNIFPMTISLWYSIDSINKGDNSNIFSKYYPAQWNGYLIHVVNNVVDGDSGIVTYPWYIRNSQNKLLGLYGEKPFYQSNVEVNKWYSYVYTVDETGGKIYVNGELVDTHVWTGESGKCSNADLWKIGGLYNHWFHGKIDDIAIWNRALKEDEIKQLYSTCKFNTVISPVANPIDKGANAVFEVSSNEPNLTYQWQTNPSNVGWLNVPLNTSYSGTSSNKLTVNDVQLSNHLQSFRVIASSETCTEISNTAYISLNDTCVNVMDEMNFISVTDTLIITVNLTGINFQTTNTIKVYPNPTSDYITINYGNLALMNGCKLSINNSIGQVVYTSSIIEQIASIKLSSLGGIGLYFVNIIDQQNKLIESRKLILKE